ncbi:hypothetical protein ACEN8K_10570 [Variovorax sp. CT11-76]
MRGVPLSFVRRRALDNQKSEGLVSAVVDFAMAAFNPAALDPPHRRIKENGSAPFNRRSLRLTSIP